MVLLKSFCKAEVQLKPMTFWVLVASNTASCSCSSRNVTDLCQHDLGKVIMVMYNDNNNGNNNKNPAPGPNRSCHSLDLLSASPEKFSPLPSFFKVHLSVWTSVSLWWFPDKNHHSGVSLVAQWLRICLPTQGTWVRALVWEDPTCHGAAGPVSHNYWACASGACAPQREGPR